MTIYKASQHGTWKQCKGKKVFVGYIRRGMETYTSFDVVLLLIPKVVVTPAYALIRTIIWPCKNFYLGTTFDEACPQSLRFRVVLNRICAKLSNMTGTNVRVDRQVPSGSN
jgi:hypothetical protein